MAFDILVKEWEGQPSLFKKSKNSDGANVETLLINAEVVLCAANEEGEYLLRVGQKMKLITSKELSSVSAFREVIRPFSYVGTANDLEYLLIYWRSIGIKHRLVSLRNYQGRYIDEFADFWATYNKLIFTPLSRKPNGVTEDLLYINGTRKIDFIVGDKWYFIDNTDIQEDMALLVVPPNNELAQLPDEELLEGWGKLYKNVPLLYIVLGWFVGCMYMKEVMEARGSKKFPLVSLSGLTQSGKTSLIATLMRFWGMNARPSDYTQISPFAELKQLNGAHYFPIWRDEFRNHGHSFAKETILRSLYDRSSVPKGTANQDLLYYNSTSTLLLSGEGVSIDPAVRRRFVYFDLQNRFKLSGADWAFAEQWSASKASELFLRALRNGFNKVAFDKIMTSDIKYKGINDLTEERVCIASLAAVFGVDFALAVLKMTAAFWEKERADGAAIDEMKVNLIENLFEFLDAVFVNTGMYSGKEVMGVNFFPPILNYFAYQSSTAAGGGERIYIKINHLVAFAFGKGFNNVTSLDQRSVVSAIRGLLNAKDRKARIGGVMSRVIQVDRDTIDRDSILNVIIDNVITISEKVGKNGRSIKQDLDEDLISYNDLNSNYLRKLKEEGDPATSPKLLN